MRLNLKPSVLGCALVGVIVSSLPAAADWHYRESNGSWTNVRYDDGICNYISTAIARTSQSDLTALHGLSI